MCQAIIFDLGGVLLTWNPEHYVSETLGGISKGDYLAQTLFRSSDWAELDRGSYSVAELQARYLKRFPDFKKEIKLLFTHWFDLFQPISKNIALIPQLKKKGYSLYILSNFVKEAIDFVQEKYDFFQFFDGKTISCYVHSIKPEPEIYQQLFQSYNLSFPSNCCQRVVWLQRSLFLLLFTFVGYFLAIFS
ncbi:MAG: HAD hydrolase-like protein [Candidatus Heimdallarchaeota archaeon]|nr:HAD hydrolase-like protein [Candidatus Heimdallarchaeota archaeon]